VLIRQVAERQIYDTYATNGTF